MKIMVIEIKHYQQKNMYLNNIRPYLKDINDVKKSDTWKIQLTTAINFIPSKDYNEERVSYINSSD